MKRHKGFLRGVIGTTVFLLIWQGFVDFFKFPDYLLPSPWGILKAFYSYPDMLTKHAFMSFLEILSGMILGTLGGALMAVQLHFSPKLRQSLMPLFVVLQAVPMFALLPLLCLWLGYGWGPKILVIALTVYFPVVVSFLEGLSQVPQAFLEQAHMHQASSFQKLIWIQIPSALPHLFAGLKIAAISAPLAVMATDWVGAQAGLGYLILYAAGRMELALMFASIFCLGLMAVLFYGFLQTLKRRVIFWPA